MIPLREKIKLAIATCVLAALAYVVICMALAADKACEMGLLK